MIGSLPFRARRRDAAKRRRRRPRLWWLPVFVWFAMLFWPQARILHLIGAGVALAIIVWGIKHPGRALVALLLFLPFQLFGFSLLYRYHVSATILRPAGAIKEALGFGILFAALHAIREGRSRLDVLDKVALGYVAVTTLYLFVPQLFVVGAPLAWKIRLLAWRADAGYVLLFFAARHAPMEAATKRWVARALGFAAAVVAACALYQWLAPTSWLNWELHTAGVERFMINVLGDSWQSAHGAFTWGRLHPVRVSSILVSPFDMPDYLLLALAFSLELIARSRRTRWPYLLGAMLFGAIYVSRTRADALAAIVIVVLALLPAAKRLTAARIRLVAGLIVAAAIIVPSLGGSRYLGNQGGSASSQGHIREIQSGLHVLATHPLGVGIGTQPGVSDRFQTTGTTGQTISDNSILQVGDELGIPTLVPWFIMVLLVGIALSRRVKQGDAFAAAVRLAFVGFLIAGLYHHVFLTYPGPWTLWAIIGLALNQSWQRDQSSVPISTKMYAG